MDNSSSPVAHGPSQPSAQGLTVLVSPENATCDIVFVHGFTGHPQRTWTHKGELVAEDRCEADGEGSEHPSKYRRLLSSSHFKRNEVRKPVYWPRDLVPATLPNARVLTYGYDTNIRHRYDAPISKSTVYDIGKDLIVSLEAERRLNPSRPLIFIAHSLGGIVVKEAIRRSHGFQSHQNHLHDIYKSTVAVIFFGTPHSGADPRSLIHHIAEKIIQAAGFSVNEQIVNTLLPTSERLRELRDEFSPMAHQEGWIIYSFQEQYGVSALNGKKVVDDVSSTLSDSIIEITQHIASNHMDMCRFKGVEDTEYKKVAAALVRISDAVMQSSKSLSSGLPLRKPLDLSLEITLDQRKDYLKTLAFPQIDARLLNIKKAHDKTCMWLLEQPEYQDWLNLDKFRVHHGFLWVKGKPGAGKSTMVKYAFAHAKREMTNSIIISFFFNARGEALEKSTLGMYRSILFQLLTAVPDLQKVFIPFASAKQRDGEVCEWNIEELKNILSSIIENLGRQHLVCFIDALDECQEDQVRDMVDFLEQLGQLAVSSGIRLNIYLSSRHYPHIGIEKGLELIIEGQQGHDEDIAKYVSSKLKTGRDKKFDGVKAEILSRASGVFLWVVLVVQMLNKAYDHGQIYALQKCLKEIPNELDNLFADILRRDGENREELIICLQWILYAQRPLKRTELYYAMMSRIEPDELTEWDPEEVTIQDMEKFILSCSKGLVEVTKAKDQTVQFIHESVRDFLLQGNGLSKLQSDLDNNIAGLSHDRLRKCCQRYIMIDLSQHLPPKIPLPVASSEEGKSLRVLVSEKFPFLEYAVRNILHHANAAEGYGISQTAFLENFSLNFETGFRAWIILDNLLERYKVRRHTLEASMLYILAERNLPNLICLQLEKETSIDIAGERHGYPLYAALFNNNEEALRVLLSVDANTRANNEEQQSSLFTASIKARNEAIRSLLEEREEIKSNFGRCRQTLLSYVAEKGHNIILALLLATGMVDVESRNAHRQTPLLLAANKGHETILALLLATGNVDVNSADNFGCTALSLAIVGGHEACVELLLATGKVNVNSADYFRRTALSLAVRGGHEACAKLLLATGKVDVNSADNVGDTALSLAVRGGHEACAKLLLGTGKVDVNSANNAGHTALSFAANKGYKACVELLLAIGEVDVNSVDNFGRTALSFAANKGHKACVELLLATGKVAVASTDCLGRTALLLAVSGGHEACTRLLLATGKVDVNSASNTGQTALSIAANKGHEACVELLLATGKVDVNSADNFGRTALSLAAEEGHEAIVRLLFDTKDLDINSKNNNGQTALSLAAKGGHKAIVELLKDNG